MKIVNRKTFLHLPAGTVFSKYDSGNFGELCIKGETVGADFLQQKIAGAVWNSAIDESHDSLAEGDDSGDSIPMDFYHDTLDGLFEKNQRFAVWEPDNVAELIERLQLALKTSTAT